MVPKELDWLLSHPETEEKYIGEYIGIVEDKIVAHGKDFRKVLAEAEQAGKAPYIHKVLPPDKEIVV